MASVALETSDKNDEIEKFINSRFITASECMWRFFAFDVHGRNPSIQHLAVHEEGRQTVIFQEETLRKLLTETRKQLFLHGLI